MSNQPIPGARSLWTVTTKLMPVKIDEKPRMKTPMIMKTTRQWLGSAAVVE